MRITGKNLKRMDEISIRTQNSEYRFLVTDPTKRKGLLSGGLLGAVEHEAALCDEFATHDQQPRLAARLEIGRCAFFLVCVKERLSRLITSEVQNVSLERIHTQVSTEC